MMPWHAERASILLVGSPGIGILEFNMGLVKTYLDDLETVVFVTIDSCVEGVLRAMATFGVDTEELLGKRLFILDHYSSLQRGACDPHLGKKAGIKQISDLEAIMMTVLDIHKEAGKELRVFIYSLSTLFLFHQANAIIKFFQLSGSQVSSQMGTMITSLHEGVHEERMVNHLMAVADGVIELRFDERMNRMMRMRNMSGSAGSTQWIRFDITSLESKPTFKILEMERR